MTEVQDRRKKTVEASMTEQVHLIMQQHLTRWYQPPLILPRTVRMPLPTQMAMMLLISLFLNSSNSCLGAWERRYWRMWTKARMMLMLTSMALGLRSTPESIATPSWVKAKGGYLNQSRSKVTFCDLKLFIFLLIHSKIPFR